MAPIERMIGFDIAAEKTMMIWDMWTKLALQAEEAVAVWCEGRGEDHGCFISGKCRPRNSCSVRIHTSRAA